jgi:hypothetical protein
MTPCRIQWAGTKRLPENTVFVGRLGNNHQSKWGTPYKVQEVRVMGRVGTLSQEAEYLREIKELYRRYITQTRPDLAAAAKFELAGKNLACSCPLDLPCHADVLLEIANSGALHG